MKGKRRRSKWNLYIIVTLLFLGIMGCSRTQQMKTQVIENEGSEQFLSRIDQEEAEKIIEICQDLYEKAAEENRFDDWEVLGNIVNRLGENGYVAVDSKNQINMTEAEQVLRFCEMTDAKEEAKLTIIEVTYFGGFVKYDLQTRDGSVDVLRSYYEYQNGQFKNMSTGSYRADSWKYTEDGYLMFSGSWFSEEQYALTLSEAEDYAAFRMKPLDETCRELNRKYLLPIGYEQNNMFLVDWSEADYGELDFYDLYDIFYPKVNAQALPYTAADNLGVGAIYRIPEAEFERVIMTYFSIDSKTLRSKAIYDPEDGTYEYKPRGFYEVEYPEYPYPEVVGFTENSDGTITLTVHVVFPYAGISKVYAHEVVIRPLEDGGVRYVSNRMISSEDNYEETWYTPRLTEEEWKEIYGECLITEEEKAQLQALALSAAEQVKDVYQDVEMVEGPSYASNIKDFTSDQCKEVISLLGQAGYVSVTEDCNMENPEKIEAFYSAYLEQRDAMVTIFDVNRDGLIGVITFIYREGELQTYYVGIGWKEGGIPELRDTLVSDVEDMKLTEKGYFIYGYENVMAHASLRQYWRTKPLSDECRELTKKYISGLSYVNYNMLVTNWDSSNVEDILMPCMFEDVYRIYTGETFKNENGMIPAELYEKVMTTYFPVSKEQLRGNCGYDEGSNSYPYEMIFASPYPPFGEVVDHTENADGTITLIVDGIWADYNSDCAFTNQIVIQPFGDGTFRYLSNSIEQKELELPPIARTEG